jgi:hypothetical protein
VRYPDICGYVFSSLDEVGGLLSSLVILEHPLSGEERAFQFIAKCGDYLREVDETAYWLELLVKSNLVAAEKLQPLRIECDELTAIFVTILKRAKE